VILFYQLKEIFFDMAMPSLPLEGDGVNEQLFFYLWSKDELDNGPSLNIPHTVIYNFTHPAQWYFTSVKSGKIKRKSKANLTNVKIEHEFTRYSLGSDLVAYYIYTAEGGETTIEYLCKSGLRKPLHSPVSPSSPVLLRTWYRRRLPLQPP
jgi:hypothetical protein